MSDFQRFPSQDEVLRLDPRWVADMQFIYGMYSFQKNQSPIVKIFDKYMAERANASNPQSPFGFTGDMNKYADST